MVVVIVIIVVTVVVVVVSINRVVADGVVVVSVPMTLICELKDLGKSIANDVGINTNAFRSRSSMGLFIPCDSLHNIKQHNISYMQ